jgi:hypothetical protein
MKILDATAGSKERGQNSQAMPVGSGKEISVLPCSPDGKPIAFANKGKVIMKALVRKAD